jgi:hypothetical protein
MEAASRPRRGWFALTLRTLFIALSIFAIWLGWWVHSARRQQQASAVIRQLGGWVNYDFQLDDLPALRKILPNCTIP